MVGGRALESPKGGKFHVAAKLLRSLVRIASSISTSHFTSITATPPPVRPPSPSPSPVTIPVEENSIEVKWKSILSSARASSYSSSGSASGSNPNPSHRTMANAQPKKKQHRQRMTRIVIVVVICLLVQSTTLSKIDLRKFLASKLKDAEVVYAKVEGESNSSDAEATPEQPHEEQLEQLQEQQLQEQPGQQQQQQQPPEQQPQARTAGKKTKKKTRFIYHIGPSKTATTTVQDDLKDLSENGMLIRDKYMFWGRGHSGNQHNGTKLRVLGGLWENDCLRSYAEYRNQTRETPQEDGSLNASSQLAAESSIGIPPCIQRIRHLLDTMHEDGISLILSDEAYSYRARFGRTAIYRNQEYLANIQHILKDWDITILATYRRPVEWMLSCIKESNSKDLTGTGKNGKWAAEGGVKPRQTWGMLTSWVQMSISSCETEEFCKTQTNKYVFSDASHYLLEKAGFNFEFLTVHGKEHISQQLMCSIITDAPASCQSLRGKSEGTLSRARSMAWYHYNTIVYAAAQRGLITNDMQANKTRIEMADDLAKYHSRVINKTLADLPLACPKETELEQMLNFSLGVEKRMFPELYVSPQGELEHRTAFRKVTITKREVCSVDIKRLFAHEESWEGFLQSLNQTWEGDEAKTRDWSIRDDWKYMTSWEYVLEK